MQFEPAAWMWTVLIERNGRKASYTWPTLHNEEEDAIKEAEYQFQGKVMKVKGKEPLFYKGDVYGFGVCPCTNERRDT